MELDKRLQDFTVDAFAANDGLLTVNIKNNGENPVEIFSLVITNSTDFEDKVPSKVHDITGDASFIPPRSDSKNIVANTPLYLDLAVDDNAPQIYKFKAISSLGRIAEDVVVCLKDSCTTPIAPPGQGQLSAIVYMDGPNGINTKNSTAVMFVTNISDVEITDVTPAKGFAPNPVCGDGVAASSMWTVTNNPVTPDLFTENVTPCEVSPSIAKTLQPYESTLFVWDGEIQGDVGAEFKFCNSVTGTDPDGPPGDVNSLPESCDYLTVIDPNDCGGCEGGGDDDILDERFITRPELFLTIPSPFGGPGTPIGGASDPDRALWGANVVNPTDTEMLIHKITITAFPPAANSNFLVIGSGNDPQDCSPRDISPGNGTIPGSGNGNQIRDQEAGFWTCPGQNTIMWRNYQNPISLPPQSTFPFLVQLESDIPIAKIAESVLVDSTVYTTSGSFGKGNYQSTAYPTAMYANIFATTDWEDPLNRDKIITSYADIPSGVEQEYSIVLTDFDTDGNTFINQTSSIVVNVPRTFSNVVLDMDKSTKIVKNPDLVNPELGNPSVTIHPDNTIQIIAEIDEHIGNVDGLEAAVLTFRATPPTVTTDKLMVMYTLANGEGTNDSSVGPLTEIILHVTP
jgi:hypothetical protein